MSIGRNDPCPCNSGKKFKLCCLRDEKGKATETASADLVIRQLLPRALQLYQTGQLVQADALCVRILALVPQHANCLHLRGLIAFRAGQLNLSSDYIASALAIAPSAKMHFSFATVMMALGRLDDAVVSYLQVLRLQPDYVDALRPLLALLSQQGRLEEAADCCRKVLANCPDIAEAHARLGLILQAQGKMDEAAASFRQALSINPADVESLNNLGISLRCMGLVEEAAGSYRQALKLRPDLGQVHSNLLFTMQYQACYSPEELFAEHLKYGARFEAPFKSSWPAHGNDRDPERRIKVGYVSADFHRHSIAFFIEPILANHDKSLFEVFCYQNSKRKDEFTERLMRHADHWRLCADLNDQQLAHQIQSDNIDILVDLSGHTGGNRLPVFARKPAPIQITWLGYPGTTGLSAMDYRITDNFLDPEGLTERYHTEKLLRLYSCTAFQPLADSPEVNRLPALETGRLTLACLNNIGKINQEVIRLWARVMAALPESTLMLGDASYPAVRQRLKERFAEEGVAEERLLLQPMVPMLDYLSLHHRIDLALDPFPYGGGTTTNHSLWMGVPVVTLAGHNTAGRHGVYNLAAAGLTEFITYSVDEYVACVLEFARDLSRLNEIRQTLRERIKSREARDPVRLTRALEATFRSVWKQWCVA